MLKRSAICLVATLTLLMGSTAVFGQLPTATILGTVKDGAGALVPGATITARNTATNDTRKAIVGADGSYRFDALPVGTYDIRAEQAGFKVEVQSGLTVTVGQQQNLDFALQVGSVVEQVEVTTAPPSVDTTRGDLGGTVNEQSMAELPLNGRDYIQLAVLQAGVTLDSSRTASSAVLAGQGTWFSANGAPPRANSYLLDGTILNTYGGASGASIGGDTLGLDGIREFRIVTNSFEASYGMFMGSQMTMVSNSGTNAFHGDVFDYLRNSALNAKKVTDTPAASGATVAGAQRRLPPYRRNNFGGAIGGPIFKDKTFFFVNYEGVRQLVGRSYQTNTIPSGCRGAAGSTITPATCPLVTATQTVNNIIAPWIALYPTPNNTALSPTELDWSYNQPDKEDYGQLRLDHTFGSKDSAFIRYTGDSDTIGQPGNYPGTPFVSTSQNHYVTAAETHTFSPYLLNTARASLAFTLQNINSPIYVNGPQYSFEGQPMGTVRITGLTDSAWGGTPASVGKQYISSYSDDLFYTKGHHSVKAGVLINHFKMYVQNGLSLWGNIAFSSYTNFLNANAQTNIQVAPGGINYRQVAYDTIGTYAQDDWKATHRLTLNLGIRYEMNTNINATGSSAAYNGALINPGTDINFTHTTLLTKNPSYLNFGPHLGAAYDVFGDGKTAIRAGFGLFYEIAGWTSFLHGDAKAPFAQNTFSAPGPITTLPIPVPTGTSLAALQSRNPYVYDWNIKQPKMTEYNLAVQQQLPWQSSITVAYAGSRGFNLQTLTDGNPVQLNGIPSLQGGVFVCVTPPAGSSVPSLSQQNPVYGPNANACNVPGVTPVRKNNNWNAYNEIADSQNSWYNALVIDFRKSATHGLQFQSNLTYSKVLDDTQGSTSAASDVVGGQTYSSFPANPMLDWGPSTFNTKYAWKTNVLYHTPHVGASNRFVSGLVNGWWASIISQVTTGYPFTVSLSSFRSGMMVNAGNSAITDRPMQNPNRNNSNITHGVSAGCQGVKAGTLLGTVANYFDPCAYTIQTAGFIGNTHRNSLVGPGYQDVDFSLVKDTRAPFLGKAGQIEARAEFFNILNTANFQVPTNNVVFAGALTTPINDVENPVANAGRLTTAFDARQIQLALRFEF